MVCESIMINSLIINKSIIAIYRPLTDKGTEVSVTSILRSVHSIFVVSKIVIGGIRYVPLVYLR